MRVMGHANEAFEVFSETLGRCALIWRRALPKLAQPQVTGRHLPCVLFTLGIRPLMSRAPHQHTKVDKDNDNFTTTISFFICDRE